MNENVMEQKEVAQNNSEALPVMSSKIIIQVLSFVYNTLNGKTFIDNANYVKRVEGAKQVCQDMVLVKKSRKCR